MYYISKCLKRHNLYWLRCTEEAIYGRAFVPSNLLAQVFQRTYKTVFVTIHLQYVNFTHHREEGRTMGLGIRLFQ